SGPNFVVHGAFDLGKSSTGGGPAGNGFTTSYSYNDFDGPSDNVDTIRTTPGLGGGTSVAVTQFPGDPVAGVAAATNSLYANGNGTGGPAILWRQTVSGLQQNTAYTFYLYASNANNGPVTQPPILPSLRFCKGVTGTGPYGCATQLSAADFSLPNETSATGDYWTRYQVGFTTGAGESSVDLAALDTASGTNGDDVQVTRLAVQACTPSTAVELMDFSATGAPNAVDLWWVTGSELHNLGFNL